MLATTLSLSVILLIVTQRAAGRAAGPALSLGHFLALILVVLCTTTFLLERMNRRSGR